MPNAYLYVPSFKLLRHLGISKVEDLPDYQKFQELNKKFENLSNENIETPKQDEVDLQINQNE
jgi:hypothetical protein